jgi:hypothetical protein
MSTERCAAGQFMQHLRSGDIRSAKRTATEPRRSQALAEASACAKCMPRVELTDTSQNKELPCRKEGTIVLKSPTVPKWDSRSNGLQLTGMAR